MKPENIAITAGALSAIGNGFLAYNERSRGEYDFDLPEIFFIVGVVTVLWGLAVKRMRG